MKTTPTSPSFRYPFIQESHGQEIHIYREIEGAVSTLKLVLVSMQIVQQENLTILYQLKADHG
jgi:hypothetical protein